MEPFPPTATIVFFDPSHTSTPGTKVSLDNPLSYVSTKFIISAMPRPGALKRFLAANDTDAMALSLDLNTCGG